MIPLCVSEFVCSMNAHAVMAPVQKLCHVFALQSEWPQLGPFQIGGQRVQVTSLQIIACEEWGPFGFPTLRLHLKSFLRTFSQSPLPSPMIDQGGILGDARGVAPRPADAHLALLVHSCCSSALSSAKWAAGGRRADGKWGHIPLRCLKHPWEAVHIKE